MHCSTQSKSAGSVPTSTLRTTNPEHPTAIASRRAYATLVDRIRELQDAVAGAVPPPDMSARLSVDVAQLATLLEQHAVSEEDQLFNRIPEVAGYGQTLTPRVVLDACSPNEVRGRVMFRRFHLGGGAAAHGGAVALLFDSLLGRLANSADRPRARTVHLSVDYRNITPMDIELNVEGRIVHEAGRKRHLEGRLYLGNTVCAEASGLFLQLLPQQQ